MSIYSISPNSLRARLRAALTGDQLGGLNAALASAEELGFNLYLVGGSLRDLILRRQSVDLDLVTEGAPAELAERIAERTGGEVKVYGRFATTCVMHGQTRVDVARARVESYRRPGALPTVHPGPLQGDLARRDFTINAMALGLVGGDSGELIDPEGGLADLEAGLLRVIHGESFIDDATRILRGLRYASRLWFDIEPETRSLMSSQAEYLGTISGSRLRTELHALLADARPWQSLMRAAELDILKAIAEGLSWDEERSAVARTMVHLAASERSLRLLVLLASTLDEQRAIAMAQRLSLGRRETRLVTQTPRVVRALRAGTEPSVKVALQLADSEPSVRAALAPLLVEPEQTQRLESMIRARPRLGGRDLISLGLTEGPEVGAVLDELRRAVISGSVTTKDDELALARKLIDSRLRDRQES